MSFPIGDPSRYAGPIMDKIKGLDRHCETVKRNSRCPYLKLGCKGCTLAPPATMPPSRISAE